MESRFEVPRIVEALRRRGHGSLCFHGAPGTGKTALAEHIAAALQRPLMIRQTSDIASKYVGETEQNMARMFEEAQTEGAVLLLDEADSFLRSRRLAERHYEVSEVNEMLQGMERFGGVFICTTNLFDDLDEAALRRFTFKLRFHVLTPEQRERMFVAEALDGDAGALTAEQRGRLAALDQLAPGDFAAVKRQVEILGEAFDAGRVPVAAGGRAPRQARGAAAARHRLRASRSGLSAAAGGRPADRWRLADRSGIPRRFRCASLQARSAARCCSSCVRLAAILSAHAPTLNFGAARPSGQSWPCQKQPCTKITLRRFGSTMSGRPGRPWSRRAKRRPRACSARLTVSSGVVLWTFTRDRAICAFVRSRDRSGGCETKEVADNSAMNATGSNFTRGAALPALLQQRIVIIDGAMGTMIQRYKLSEADYRGERFKDHPKDLKGNNDLLQLTRPDVIRADPRAVPGGRRRHHRDQHLRRHQRSRRTTTAWRTLAREMNVAAARLARAACDKFSTPDKPRFVAGALGPTPRTASISPDVNDPGRATSASTSCATAYHEQAEGLLEGGCDLFLVETIFDTLNAKAAIFALDELMEDTGERLPVIVSRHGDRRLGPHPVGPDGGRVLAFGAPCAAAGRGPELRARRGADAALHRGAGQGGRRHLHQLLPERRPAQPDERDRLRRDARRHRRA